MTQDIQVAESVSAWFARRFPWTRPLRGDITNEGWLAIAECRTLYPSRCAGYDAQPSAQRIYWRIAQRRVWRWIGGESLRDEDVRLLTRGRFTKSANLAVDQDEPGEGWSAPEVIDLSPSPAEATQRAEWDRMARGAILGCLGHMAHAQAALRIAAREATVREETAAAKVPRNEIKAAAHRARRRLRASAECRALMEAV